MVSKDKTQIHNNSAIFGLSMPKTEIELLHEMNQKLANKLTKTDIFVSPLEGVRKCCRCRNYLPIIQFNKDRSKKSGLQSKCRGCSNSCVVLWRAKQTSLRGGNLRVRRPRTKGKYASKYQFVENSDVQGEVKERAFRDDGLNIRSRRHVSTGQRYRSKSAWKNSEYLEGLANEILESNPVSE